jgi:Zn-dependent metalloprotease/subtilisin-like proprotein convertase family protein
MQQITFWEKQSTKLAGDVAQAAVSYMKRTNALTESGGDWIVRAVRRGAGGDQHVRLAQVHEGVRVWGGDVVVHATDTEFKSVKGNRVKNLVGFDVSPVLSAETALRLAKGAYQTKVKSSMAAEPLEFQREATELVIFPQFGRDARLAWHAVFSTELQAGVSPGRWNYFIDAKTGDIVEHFNGIHTLSQASGPGGNLKVPRTWNMELDVEPVPNSTTQYKMDTAKLQTFNMNNSTSGTGTIVTGPLSPIGDAPINDAHGFAEKTLGMLLDWNNANSIDDNGFIIKSRVHYGTNYENAFWDGTQMTYGDGASTFYPLSGDVDVVGHEIAHGYTSFHSDLVYSGESGGMNEAFSDIAGAMTEFYTEGDTADFLVGADIFKAANQALRYMCNPPQDGISIGHYADYTPGMDVHFSSGIANKAFCLAARRFASGSPTGNANTASVRKVGRAFFEANRNHWTASSTFPQSCQGVMDAATALGFTTQEKDYLRTSWTDVGVYCDGAVEPIVCDETLTAAQGVLTSPNYPNAYPNNYRRTWCIQPTGGASATLTFTNFATELNYDFVSIKNGVTGAVLSTTSGSVAPPPATSSWLVVKFTTDSLVTASGWRAEWTTGGPVNQAPVVAITAPTAGQVVSGNVAIAATATDADGTIAKVTFTLPNGTTIDDTSSPYTAAWNSTTVADGMYTLKAKAFDNLGAASDEKTVTVEVKNSVACVNGTFSSSHPPVGIPDNYSGGITSQVTVFNAGAVGAMTMSLNITHPWRGDLRVILTSPLGQQHVVHDRSGGAADNLILTNVPLPAFVGVTAAGPWTLRVIDTSSADVGTLVSWSLNIVGNCAPPGDFAGKAEPNLPLVDNGSACSTLTVSGGLGDSGQVRLDIDGVHAYRSILRGTLAHNGVTVVAFPVMTFPNGQGIFNFENRPVPGLTGDVNGTWTLCIIDTDPFGDTGTLKSWSVHD